MPSQSKPRGAELREPSRSAMIAIVGAESTGKSTLARALAQQLSAYYLPEYLREFCELMRRTPTAQEQSGIVTGQLAAEARALDDPPLTKSLIIVDSTPLMTAIYSWEYFSDRSLLAAAIVHQRHYALTLVAGDDIAWVADGIQRDSPQVAQRCQRRLIETLEQHAIAFSVLSGSVGARTTRALMLMRAAGL